MKYLKWPLILIGLFIFNLLLFECLLRVNGIFQFVIESRLVRELKDADHIFDFSPGMKESLVKLGLENKLDTAYHGKSKRIPYSATENSNPYPAILHLFHSEYVIYNKDFELKQITILSGECDATPSMLVDKARGEQTGYGDHFVTYIFYQSGMSGTGVDFDRIDWYSWRGGSYDGFEEFWIFPLTLIQFFLLIGWAIVKRMRKHGNPLLRLIRDSDKRTKK